MKKPTVSIIVPVYKTEQYLKECIDSILKQDYPAIEIILVDDGSPDNCPALCDWYARQYPNIQSVHPCIQGLAYPGIQGWTHPLENIYFSWILTIVLTENMPSAS